MRFYVTTVVGHEEDWANTSCPPPPESILDMARVGGEFYAEWMAAINAMLVSDGE